jgi:hypothetical protein
MTGPAGPTGVSALRRFVRPPADQAAPAQAGAPALPMPGMPGPASGGPPVAQGWRPAQNGPAPERCELCSAEIPAGHGHVADLDAASLQCACRACYLLFTQPNAGRGRYRAVPDRYLHDPGRVMAPAEWDQLEVPVGLAFFLRTSRDQGALAGFYPSPAGVTECQLDLELWQQLVADYPLLSAAADDVEAVLISRTDDGVEYFLVPVDICYELAGRMRLTWHGFDGGTEARDSIAAFLATVRGRARRYRDGSPDA